MWKRMVAASVLTIAALSVVGCAAIAEGYMTGATGSYAPPDAGSPSATLVFNSPDVTPIDSTTVDIPLSNSYTVSHHPVTSRDKTSVRLFGYGETAELQIHADRPVYVSAIGHLWRHSCALDVVFHAEASHSYSITPVYTGPRCRLEITDLESNSPVVLRAAPRPR